MRLTLFSVCLTVIMMLFLPVHSAQAQAGGEIHTAQYPPMPCGVDQDLNSPIFAAAFADVWVADSPNTYSYEFRLFLLVQEVDGDVDVHHTFSDPFLVHPGQARNFGVSMIFNAENLGTVMK